MRNFKAATIFPVVLAILFFTISSVSAEQINTFEDENRNYITTGYVVIPLPPGQVTAILEDYSAYNRWIVRGLDGSTAESPDVMATLEDVMQPDPLSLRLIVDINLNDTIKKNDLEADFFISSVQQDNPWKQNFVFSIKESSIFFRNVYLLLEVSEHNSETLFSFSASVRFSWFVNLALGIDSYRKAIEWRVDQVIENLVLYAMDKSGEGVQN